MRNEQTIRLAAVVLVLGITPGNAASDAVLHSVYAPEPPKIDGRIEAAEWAGADSLVITARNSDLRCIVLIMNDKNNLYLAFSALDDKTNSRGSSAFDNVAAWFRGEVGYWLYGSGKLRTDAVDSRQQRTAPFQSFADGAVVGPPRAPHMAYELLVPLDEIGAEPGENIAVGLHYWDGYDRGPSYWWPAAVDLFALDSYGSLAIAAKAKQSVRPPHR